MDKKILEEYVEQGASTRQIAKEENCGQTNVRYWLNKHNLSTKPNYNRTYEDRKCLLCKNITKRGKTCDSCNNKVRRYRVKKAALFLKGNKCQSCGWQGHTASLTFHHLYDKEFTISHAYTQSWERVKIELDKCEVLCANCHNERHSEYSEEFIKIAEDYNGKILEW